MKIDYERIEETVNGESLDPKQYRYEATIDGRKVATIAHGGVSGYAWTVYIVGGRKSDQQTLAAAKQVVEWAVTQ